MAFYQDSPTNKTWLYKSLNQEQVELVINHSDLDPNCKENCGILRKFKTVGSYSWSSQSTEEKPIIVIPGKCAQLVKPLLKRQLNKSKQEQMVDENRFYLPDYPLEPLFRSVAICTPDFNFGDVDFVSDRNGLRKLLDFVEGSNKNSFRIDFQKIGNLIAFIRNDEFASKTNEDYGKDFERNCTIKEIEDQGSNRKIVSYQFGSFKFLLRFELDCIESEEESTVDNLLTSMASVSINQKATETSTKFANSNLAFIRGGNFLPNDKNVELTTKSTYRGTYDFPESKWNQLFFSQTDRLVIGWHQRGMLKDIEKLTFNEVTERCKRTEDTIKEATNKLHSLLQKLKSLEVFHSTQNQSTSDVYSIVYFKEDNERSLKVYKCPGHPGSLPKEFVETLEII